MRGPHDGEKSRQDGARLVEMAGAADARRRGGTEDRAGGGGGGQGQARWSLNPEPRNRRATSRWTVTREVDWRSDRDEDGSWTRPTGGCFGAGRAASVRNGRHREQVALGWKSGRDRYRGSGGKKRGGQARWAWALAALEAGRGRVQKDGQFGVSSIR